MRTLAVTISHWMHIGGSAKRTASLGIPNCDTAWGASGSAAYADDFAHPVREQPSGG
jgi:hypothetical protein